MTADKATENPKSDPSPRPGTALRRWPLAELLGEAREAIIEHGGESYRLRLTANQKLILTK